MKIVIIGIGKVGLSLAQALAREGHDLTLIDSKMGVLEPAERQMDVLVYCGNGADLEMQKKAGVQSADLMIAVTSADELNLMCCMIAKKLGCRHTIARVRNPEYTKAYYFMRDELGLSMVVNPERSAAREIHGLLRLPSSLRRETFAKGRAEIVELPVREGEKLDGLKLVDLYAALKSRVLICCVERGGEVYIPRGDFVLRGGDKIYATAQSNHLMSFVRFAGLETSKIRSVMIIGGSKIAVYLAGMLSETGIQVKIIDIDPARCELLSERLENATIIRGDGTSFDVLCEEGAEETDAIVSLMSIDEQNLVVSMFAKGIHVPKVIAKINRTEYSPILRSTDVDCVITPHSIAATQIVRYVRAMENGRDQGAITLHRMVDNQIEALEFSVTESTLCRDLPLKSMHLKKDLLVAIIHHGENVLIPGGNDCFTLGDSVVIVTKADRNIDQLNDIFEAD